MISSFLITNHHFWQNFIYIRQRFLSLAGNVPTLTRTGAAPENDFHEIEVSGEWGGGGGGGGGSLVGWGVWNTLLVMKSWVNKNSPSATLIPRLGWPRKAERRTFLPSSVPIPSNLPRRGNWTARGIAQGETGWYSVMICNANGRESSNFAEVRNLLTAIG